MADECLAWMEKERRTPSAIYLKRNKYIVVAKAIEVAAKREKIDGFDISDFRYKGYPLARANI